MPVRQWIANAHSSFPDVKKALGRELYEYIAKLEGSAHHGTMRLMGMNNHPDVKPELDVLTGTPLSMAFLYLAAIDHPFDGMHCNYYTLQEPSHNMAFTIECIQQFDQLASIIK